MTAPSIVQATLKHLSKEPDRAGTAAGQAQKVRRSGGVAAVCHAAGNLAARQGRSACPMTPGPHDAAWTSAASARTGATAPAPMGVAKPALTRRLKNVTRPTLTHLLQGIDFRAISAGFGVGWNHGTRLEPMTQLAKPLIMKDNSAAGTVEPWNPRGCTRAGRCARIVMFHGSMVPEGYIYQSFQWVDLGKRAVPARFHGSSDRKRGQN